MEGGPPSFTPGSSFRALLRNSTSTAPSSSPTGLSPSSAPRSRGLRLTSVDASVGPTTPVPQGDWFGLGPVRSPLLGASRLISLPPGTEMFQFPGFALHIGVTGVPTGRVSPFGHPGLTACVRLPPAYRSLPRPSSPPCAQASPTGLRSLDHLFVMKQSTRCAAPEGVGGPRAFNSTSDSVFDASARSSLDELPVRSRITVLIHIPQSLPFTCQTARAAAGPRSVCRRNRDRDR